MKKNGPQFTKSRHNTERQTLIQTAVFEKKYKELESRAFADKERLSQIEKAMRLFFNEQPLYIVFVSICNGDTRAVVKKGTGITLKEAWDHAGKNVVNFLKQKPNYNPKWVKVDIVSDIVQKEYADICRDLQISRGYFYRVGISFDENFKRAMIESELNCRMIYDYKEKNISLKQLNQYYKEMGLDGVDRIPDQIFTFQCQGYIYDEMVYQLYDKGYDYGRRILEFVNKEVVHDILEKSSRFLIDQVQSDGKFIYGCYPLLDKNINGYNILRHASSLWGLILGYKILKNDDIREKIDLGIKYLLENIKYYNDTTAFIVDESFGEIKLGGNAVAIIMLTEYMNTFLCNDFSKTIDDLGNGILKLQNNMTGEFYHVLNAADFTGKNKERTVYYDGEAAFALIRLYKHSKDEKWLSAARTTFKYFVENSYSRYADHWLSYAINEYLKFEWNADVFGLGRANVENNLQRIYERDTTYHTFLELLMAAFEMTQHIAEAEATKSKLAGFPMKELTKVIFHRVNHQLNGFIYPEVGMYFKNPVKVVNTFCVRHDAFRVRIDDVQHFIDGYYYFYRYYDSLMKYL